MTKKVLLKSLPYLAAIITGGIFYFLANKMDPYYDLLINISATFFAIPLLYLFSETAKSFSHKRLNREIFDYAKMQIDRELLSILNQLQKIDVLYIDTKERAEGYEIQNGIEINPENNKFPNRCLLLKHLDKDKFIVWDFGDIPKYNLKKCLNYYEINPKQLEAYSAVIFELLKDINGWLDVTGKEFVIDTKMFRMQGKKIMQ